MRVAFISTMAAAPWGGSEELWSHAALRLRQEGHEVAASVCWWPNISPRITALEKQGVKIFFHGSPRLGARVSRQVNKKIFGSEKELEAIKRLSPDLMVISQGGIQDGLPAMKYCRDQKMAFAVIAHCNGENFWPEDAVSGDLLSCYQAARTVFCVSQGNLKMLELQLGTRLPNALVIWNPQNETVKGAVAWPEDTGVWNLASVARLNTLAKGHDVLLRVMAEKRWRERPVKVNLYGSGEYEKGLKRTASFLELKNVHFVGHVSDIGAVWKANHLLLLPSRFEGLPLVLVDAMKCARAAVVTDVGGNAEICLEGKTGFVADAPTVKSFGEALERAWDRREDWRKMGEAAHTFITQLVPKDPVGDFCGYLKKALG